MSIVVAEPLPPVCVGPAVMTVSVDGSMIKTLVDAMLSGVASRCELAQRLPCTSSKLDD